MLQFNGEISPSIRPDFITVRDGRDTRIKAIWELPDPHSELNWSARQMRAEIEKVIDQVMASTPWHKYRVQVNRFKAEWILWRREFTLKQFMEEFFWKIDDPVINVYPHDFMPIIQHCHEVRDDLLH